MNQERPISAVPLPVIGLLVISLTTQIVWHIHQPPSSNPIKLLSTPFSTDIIRLFSLGDSLAVAKILMLWLQSFDSQAGQFLSYKKLNYDALYQWLKRILELDKRSQYPLLAATHLYSNVADPVKGKQMLEFVYQEFFYDPERRWPWLAHATALAKHRLHDLPLALKYAKAIADYAPVVPNMPRWAQEMQIFILEDMGELQQAQKAIDDILNNPQLTDLAEIDFLKEKYQELAKKQINGGTNILKD